MSWLIDVTLAINSFIVFSDHRSGDFITDFISRNQPSKVDADLTRCFPNLKAVIYTEYIKGSRNIEAHHKVDVHLRSTYRPCSTNDLYLWSIINRQGKQSSLFIYTPYLFRSSRTSKNSTDDIIPFAPSNPALISRIFIRSENFNDNDAGPVSAAFGTALALASYSRGYWGTDAHRKGKKGGIVLPGRQITIDVELASENPGVESCMPKVSFLQDHSTLRF
jgi:hypothetical protein